MVRNLCLEWVSATISRTTEFIEKSADYSRRSTSTGITETGHAKIKHQNGNTNAR